jgi:hypothetical protein
MRFRSAKEHGRASLLTIISFNMRPRRVWFPLSQILSWTAQPNACILA